MQARIEVIYRSLARFEIRLDVYLSERGIEHHPGLSRRESRVLLRAPLHGRARMVAGAARQAIARDRLPQRDLRGYIKDLTRHHVEIILVAELAIYHAYLLPLIDIWRPFLHLHRHGEHCRRLKASLAEVAREASQRARLIVIFQKQRVPAGIGQALPL